MCKLQQADLLLIKENKLKPGSPVCETKLFRRALINAAQSEFPLGLRGTDEPTRWVSGVPQGFLTRSVRVAPPAARHRRTRRPQALHPPGPLPGGAGAGRQGAAPHRCAAAPPGGQPATLLSRSAAALAHRRLPGSHCTPRPAPEGCRRLREWFCPSCGCGSVSDCLRESRWSLQACPQPLLAASESAGRGGTVAQRYGTVCSEAARKINSFSGQELWFAPWVLSWTTGWAKSSHGCSPLLSDSRLSMRNSPARISDSCSATEDITTA